MRMRDSLYKTFREEHTSDEDDYVNSLIELQCREAEHDSILICSNCKSQLAQWKKRIIERIPKEM